MRVATSPWVAARERCSSASTAAASLDGTDGGAKRSPTAERANQPNALAAIAVGLSCEVSLNDIQLGLSSVSAVSGRLALVETISGAILVDDCYNAQPGSVKAAIDLLAKSKGRRTLVLGAMKELGPQSESLHIEVAEYRHSYTVQYLPRRYWTAAYAYRYILSPFSSFVGAGLQLSRIGAAYPLFG